MVISGKFVQPTFQVGPRPRSVSFEGNGRSSSGLFSSGGVDRNGYYIVTPFDLSVRSMSEETGGQSGATPENRRRILVSRG